MKLLLGDCLEILGDIEDCCIDSVVTDPPYGLSFMGKDWDGDVPCVSYWIELLRVLKPGGHLLSFGAPRTYHRMACSVEDAGFEIRDQIMWIYGCGFPKSMNVSKAIESTIKTGGSNSVNLRRTEQMGGGRKYSLVGRNNGILGEKRVFDRREWSPSTDEALGWVGWGTALKPAHEPIVVARKKPIGTVANNVLEHGTGSINIDGCRVKCAGDKGRWPANLILDGSDEVLWGFPSDKSRFFYCAKPSKKERGDGNNHPTTKPVSLMRYLCRLVTPSGGTVLDPFMGSGTTGVAASIEGFGFLGIEKEPDYFKIASERLCT